MDHFYKLLDFREKISKLNPISLWDVIVFSLISLLNNCVLAMKEFHFIKKSEFVERPVKSIDFY